MLGYLRDIAELCIIADAFCFPSYREGLSVALMEAMTCGLPVVCSKIRSNVDLIVENSGLYFDPNSIDDCKNAIEKLLSSDMKHFGFYNREKIKNFNIDAVIAQMKTIYEK